MSRDPRIPWHELLGKALTDALIGLPYSVSTEEELALRSQQLDPDEVLQCFSASPQRSGSRGLIEFGRLHGGYAVLS